MNKVVMLLMLLLLAPAAFAQQPDQALVEKARAEGKVSFYANITAVEPIMNAFTKKYGVHTLVYYELHADMSEAICREKQLKK